ncbi:TonB-dependent receptor [Mucilaginibacter sp. L3T2-6]|uniref:TonB-dependent receptor domain-containing protein n=1 Tax=Mucilaginibacter sp. L3T2-6 TaxID=3062491 RepID=UPI002675E50F|nr:TonB-dependent receptor [Mucilaginibacter sp. L3T2-6]MDO3642108.1 TonB-dependent receptor [Mucilaginibacter sp. L3T2-6]MDV6214602.1 TonB-dependent receptor [Mucilaginibacter sp. L3T2-6]
MKRLLLMAMCCCLSAMVSAQTASQLLTVKGTAIDSATNQPVGWATVALLDASTKKSVMGGLTKDDGTLELEVARGKSYLLTIASVGYMPKTVAISGDIAVVNVGKVLLSPARNALKEVSVTAVKPIVKQEIDRISYDVQADPETKTQNVLDMLRKVPLVTVDASDNIQLKGGSSYKILINGKPSSLVANNPSDVFKSMPASSIQKIEVITTPPAKYDAEGLTGIINIITNKKIDQGYNGSINLRDNTLYGPGGGISLNVKRGKLGISNYTGYNKRIGQASTSSYQLQTFGDNPTDLDQNSSSRNHGHFLYSSTELSYEIDSLNLITGSIDFNNGHFYTDGSQVANEFAGGTTTPIQSYRISNSNNSRWRGMDFGINYQLGFKGNKDRLLTFSYKYSNSPNNSLNMSDITERFNYTRPSYMQVNDAGVREQTIQADYVHPLKNLTIEGGVKAILRHGSSDFETSSFVDSTGVYVTDPRNSDLFIYNQDVYSLYNTYQYNLNGWGIKGGIRLENTDINVPGATDLDQNYTNLIPSVSLQRKLKNGTSFTFGFTNRIQRPNVYQLNPFVNTSNPNFISSGNPALRPVLNHNFELNYSHFSKGSVNLGLSYGFSDNTIQNVTTLRGSDTSFTTYQNVGSNRVLGLNAGINYPVTKKLNFNLNAQLSNIWLHGVIGSQFYSNKGLQGNVFAYAGYKFNDTWRAGVNAGFNSAYISLQGQSSSFVWTGVSTSKDILKKKGTIFLNVSNPTMHYRTFKSETNDPAFHQHSISESPTRSFNFGFSYRFGKLSSEIKKNRHGINNDDTNGAEKPATGK